MFRILFATALGLAGFIAYIAGAIVLADRVAPLHWAIQAAYFVIAGVLWVFPAHFLILWAGRK
jgi:Protein of unknown function (DUF2842)